jgi:chaperonin GroES
MKLKPLFDRIVVKPLTEKQEKIGNILLPEISQHPEICEVVALGIGKIDNKDVEFEVKIGDHVLFNKYVGSEFKIDNQTYIIVKEIDILAVVEK